MFKKWTAAMTLEIPNLVKMSSIYPELKPENITFIELAQTEGGFIAGHYEVVFRVGLIVKYLLPFLAIKYFSVHITITPKDSLQPWKRSAMNIKSMISLPLMGWKRSTIIRNIG